MLVRVGNPVRQQPTTSQGNSAFSSSDDNLLTKQVIATHRPDGTDIDTKFILNFIEDIFRLDTMNVDPSSSGPHIDGDKLNDKRHKTNANLMLSSLSHITDTLAREMGLTARGVHTTTIAILHGLGNFHWDAKLVLNLAAFALNYRKLWQLTQIYSSNQLAKSIPTIKEHTASLKPRFDALNKLILSILELTRCILQYKALPFMYITSDTPSMSSAMNAIPIAVYWSIRGLIARAAQNADLANMGQWYLFPDPVLQRWELSALTLKIDHINEFLKYHLEICNRLVGDEKEQEFRRSFNQLFETRHIDNMKILKILITPRDDILPLFNGNTKRRVSLEFLRRRKVLLLISGLDISSEDLSMIRQIYGESRIYGARKDAPYEVVWMPIVDPSVVVVRYTAETDMKFKQTRDLMPWYSMFHPSIIDRAVIRSIGDRWHFRKEPILVVLDPQGRELSPNAMHMIRIWLCDAFPFTSMKEEQLWRDETWRLELLVDGVDPYILDWIYDEKYIILFGGDDIEWIRKFTTTVRAMASAARIPLEMFYVGKSKETESVHRANATISVEKLSHCFEDPIMMWYFWTRIESMWYSKIQLKKAVHQDPMMQQIKKMLIYEKDGSWALLSTGSKILTDGHGTTMMQTGADFDMWKKDIEAKGFDLSFTEYHDKLQVTTNNSSRQSTQSVIV